ncbi:MAG: ATP-binding protein, partial [Gemmatimonadetes bacterium]|nr:ATP-binding protein [Gemmatimonadota bacterium]
LADVRAWYEERVRGAGLEHIEPLWGEPPIELVYEVVERGYRALIVGVDIHRGAAAFLGRELDADMLTALSIAEGLDPTGERGEYHTFVHDGPAFASPIPIHTGQVWEVNGHRLLDLLPRM